MAEKPLISPEDLAGLELKAPTDQINLETGAEPEPESTEAVDPIIKGAEGKPMAEVKEQKPVVLKSVGEEIETDKEVVVKPQLAETAQEKEAVKNTSTTLEEKRKEELDEDLQMIRELEQTVSNNT